MTRADNSRVAGVRFGRVEQRKGAGQAGRHAAVAVGCTLLVTLLVAWAASIGPGRVLEGEGPGRIVLDTPTTSDTAPTGEPGLEPLPPPERREPSLLLAVVAVVLQVAALGVLLVGLFLAVRWLWDLRLRIRRRVPTPEVEFDVVEAPERVAEAVVRDAADQRLLLLSGTPRNGIVACWNRFEVQAAAVGVPRRPWETSSEYTLRILDLARADTHAVAALAELFREARFSEHELGEPERRRAVALLDEIHASLGRRPSGVGS
jgi:hypothetical protein